MSAEPKLGFGAYGLPNLQNCELNKLLYKFPCLRDIATAAYSGLRWCTRNQGLRAWVIISEINRDDS